MKILLSIILIAGIVYFGWQAIQTKPSDAIPQAVITDTVTPPVEEVVSVTETAPSAVLFDNQNVTVGFTGFGPGKEHVGTVTVQSADLVTDEKLGAKGTVVVDIKSITADVPAVATHLKTKDFFDAEKFPTAKLVVESVKDTTLTGKLTIKGVTKQISFPIVKTDAAYTAEFRVNMKDFGIVQKFANEEFVVRVSVPLKK
jgi:polyisoprenoid-binding protein YceI